MSGGTHLTLEERERLAAFKAEGLSLRGIAARLGRAASTVSRELRRNALPKGGYLPVHAEGCYRERRQRQAILECTARARQLRGQVPHLAGARLRLELVDEVDRVEEAHPRRALTLSITKRSPEFQAAI